MRRALLFVLLLSLAVASAGATAGPPLLTTGTPVAGPGLKASLLGTVERTDGTTQVTYAHHPLYTDAGGKGFGLTADTKPGDVNGQAFAAAWYVLSPRGVAITANP